MKLFARRRPRTARILIVEDEPLVAFDTEHFLVTEGYSIAATVDSVATALAAIEADNGIDLVLVDVGLADGTGLAVAEAARQNAIEVLFVTGNLPEAAHRMAAGCLTKPYPQRDLVEAIEIIRRVRSGEAISRVPPTFTLFGTD